MEVYKAISAVQADLAKAGISKDSTNSFDNYKFRGIDAVYGALSPLLAKHGLCMLPRMLSRESVERVTAKGGALFYVTVDAEYDFVSALDGSKHTVRVFGEAMDRGDKATNKAMSAAYKYAAFQAFAIPTEGDNDADSQSHEVKAAPKGKPNSDAWEQAALIGWDREKIEAIGRIALEWWEADDVPGAADYLDQQGMPNEAKIAVATMFESKFRTALKKLHAERNPK